MAPAPAPALSKLAGSKAPAPAPQPWFGHVEMLSKDKALAMAIKIKIKGKKKKDLRNDGWKLLKTIREESCDENRIKGEREDRGREQGLTTASTKNTCPLLRDENDDSIEVMSVLIKSLLVKATPLIFNRLIEQMFASERFLVSHGQQPTSCFF